MKKLGRPKKVKEVEKPKVAIPDHPEVKPKAKKGFKVGDEVETPDGVGVVTGYMKISPEGSVLPIDAPRTDFEEKVTVKLNSGAHKTYSGVDLK